MPAMTSDQLRRLRDEAASRLEWTFDGLSGVGGTDESGKPKPSTRTPDAVSVRGLTSFDVTKLGRPWGATRLAARDAFHLLRSDRAGELDDVWDALCDRTDDLLAGLAAGPPDDSWEVTTRRQHWMGDVAMLVAAAVLPALGRAGRADRMVALVRRFVSVITGEPFVDVPGAGGDLPRNRDEPAGEPSDGPRASARMLFLAPVLWSLVAHLPQVKCPAA